MKKILSVLSVCLLMAGAAQAAIINGNTSDAIIRSSGNAAQGFDNTVINGTAATLRVGNWDSSSGQTFAIDYVFELPDLGAVANPFDSATLNFRLQSSSFNVNYNADLYGITARTPDAPIPDDFYVGDATDPFATKLQDSILTPTSSAGFILSDDIASYLNTQYASGANSGSFVFLRLNRDGPTARVDERTGYIVATADNATATDRPFIEYTVIPEPATLGMLGVSALLLTQLRRRQRRS